MQATKLVANDIVEVYGIPDMTGVLKATRIERKPGTAEVRLIGTVQSAGSASFTISGITVQFSSPASSICLQAADYCTYSDANRAVLRNRNRAGWARNPKPSSGRMSG